MTSQPNSGPTVPRGERELVRRLGTLLGAPAAAVRGRTVFFGDDMAGVPAGEGPLLWTVDMLMDGVDFDSRKHPWGAIGRKAMAVNLSDCAAMAVQPAGALCAVALANRLSPEEALELHRGAQLLGVAHGCPIMGGDTNSWDGPTVISITVAARPWPDAVPTTRRGARDGDRIWISGRVGGSILGRHMTFEPRLTWAHELARALSPHAMIDISDGVALDLSRVLEASGGLGAVVEESLLAAAVHPDAERLAAEDGRQPLEHALHDGEDFELLVVLPSEAPPEECARLGLLPLGEVVAEAGLWLSAGDGARTEIPARGWEHFR